jgi:Ca2+-binding EF-hand superfamily protein
MKISSENAALALTQTNPSGAIAKRREAAELEAAKAKSSDGRTIVDTVELTDAKPAAQVSRTDAQTSTPVAQSNAGAPADPLADILKAFGQRSTDAGFSSALDVNGDGVINFADLNAALTKQNAPGETNPPTGGPLPVEPDPLAPTPASLDADEGGAIDAPTGAPAPTTGEEEEGPAVFTAEDVDRALGAFGTSEGDDAFNSAYDFDNDGVINFGDLNELLSRIGAGANAQQTLLDQLTERFGASNGDERFNANLDFDNDGVINFGDLNTLLANLAQNPNGDE